MKFGDRALETTTTAGTGSYSLAGTPSAYTRTFLATFGNVPLIAYCCEYADPGSDGTAWEIGYGTLSGGVTLTRNLIASSSGSLIDWSAEPKRIYSPPVGTVLTALLTGFQASSRPAYLPTGGTWTDSTDAANLIRNHFDGSQNIPWLRIDPISNTAIFRDHRASNLTSGTTTDLGAVVSRFVYVTGDATITSFGTSYAGDWRLVRFDGGITLTHSAPDLVLPGSANIVTVSGDVGICVSNGSGSWRVLYFRISGKTVVPLAYSDITGTPTAASDSAAGIIEIAVQSEQEAGTDATRAVTPGRQHFHPSAAKAYVNYDQITPAVARGYNVSSVTDNSAGIFSVNFTTSFSDSTYAITGWARDQTGTGALTTLGSRAGETKTSSVAKLFSQDGGTLADSPENGAAFHGDL